MPDGKAVLIMLAVAATIWAGDKAVVATRDHVVKPAYHHVIKPAACDIKKALTLGHKSCAAKK